MDSVTDNLNNFYAFLQGFDKEYHLRKMIENELRKKV